MGFLWLGVVCFLTGLWPLGLAAWGVTEALNQVSGEVRCLVFYVLIPAIGISATAIAAGLVWLAARIGG